jgi:hypothetical protein
MNDVRDEALGALLDGAAPGIEPAPGDGLQEVLRRGSRRRVIRFTAIGAAVVVFTGSIAWAGLTLPRDIERIPADIREWRTFASLEDDGWTAQVPPSWRIQDVGRCQGPHLQLRGAIVISVDFELRNRQGGLAGCWDAYVWAGFPRDGVGFAFQPYSPFGLATRGPVTPFPLTPDAFAQTGAVRGGPSESYAIIRIPGEFYPVAFVRRWLGPDASPDDVATLDRLLGSLQVLGAARWTEVSGAHATLHDEVRDYSVTYPSGWTVAEENLTPWLSSPGEILSLGTFPLRVSEDPDDGLRILDAPVAPAALADMDARDALISIQETSNVDPDFFEPRSPTFGPLGCEDAIYGCRPSEDADLPDAARNVPFRAWWIPFRDSGRAFYLFVAIGNEAAAGLRADAWAVADSLAFGPDAS